MKRVLILLLSAVLMTAALTGCSSGEEDALVSKTPFPEFSEVDIAGDEISSDIFADYDATIVNFWNNGCGSCIAEMPELEELYQDFKERNINLIGVGTDSGESREQLDTAREILKEKGVTSYRLGKLGFPLSNFYAMKHGDNVSTHTINQLCRLLQCRVEDVMEYIDEE